MISNRQKLLACVYSTEGEDRKIGSFVTRKYSFSDTEFSSSFISIFALLQKIVLQYQMKNFPTYLSRTFFC